ncbi:DegV family protein [Leptolinea tardivitalis]|uniref:DegV family protein n=1 Tax=Leptolinea tardivitalis TaxID=229920 RepID=UPI00078157DC|nr:DegV family protein [Leptolinea tardivitalis]GAP21358.1 protein containing EDD domain protein, DegV family [Leptolinea tardivitalis]
MKHKIALITDSTCDIPREWITQYDICVVPLTIVMKGETFTDGVDITPIEFYERLAAENLRPTTSQPAPKLFLDAYKKAAEDGYEQVLVITISSAMSGTIESARRAAEESPIPVKIMDGKSNSMGIGWQVIAAARAREAGGGLTEMLAAAEQARSHMQYYISLDTIEYLARGGRIADAARFLNSILHIKPMIYVKHETGTVGAAIPSRSRKAAIEDLYKEFFRHIDTSLPLHITVLHNNALPEAKELMERVIRDFSPKEIFISIVSPVLGVHTGPRAIALCGYAG